MRFGVARLQANRLVKFGSGRRHFAHLQENQSEVVVFFREAWFAAYEFTKNIGGAGQVALLAEDQAQLNTRVRILRIQAECFVQLPDRVDELPRLRQGKTVIVVRLGQIRVRHDRGVKLLERLSLVIQPPIQEPQTRVRLGIIWL